MWLTVKTSRLSTANGSPVAGSAATYTAPPTPCPGLPPLAPAGARPPWPPVALFSVSSELSTVRVPAAAYRAPPRPSPPSPPAERNVVPYALAFSPPPPSPPRAVLVVIDELRIETVPPPIYRPPP